MSEKKKGSGSDFDFDMEAPQQNVYGWQLPDIEDNAQVEVPVEETTEENAKEDISVTAEINELLAQFENKEEEPAVVEDIPAEIPEYPEDYISLDEAQETVQEESTPAVPDEPAETISEENIEPQYEEEKPKKKKKGFFSRLFGRKNREEEAEEEIFGIQLNPENSTSPAIQKEIDSSYALLFDENVSVIDEQAEASFNQIEKERRRRLAEAENKGVNMDALENEYGIAAPPPVTTYTGEIDLSGVGLEAESDYARAMADSAKSRTMEIKLNVLNDTVEINKVLNNMPTVDAETVGNIEQQAKIYNTLEMEIPDELPEDTRFGKVQASADETQSAEETPVPENTEETETAPEEEASYFNIEFPQVEDNNKYRARTLPVHNINIDVVQDAIDAEVADYDERTGEYRGRQLRDRKQHRGLFAAQNFVPEEKEESPDDFTSMDEAKDVAANLKAESDKLNTLKLVSSILTFVLFIAGLILEGNGSSTKALIFVAITFVAVIAEAVLSWKSFTEGIKNLLSFNATSDSAVSVAMLFTALQCVLAVPYITSLAEGTVHLYGALVSFLVYLNAYGKSVRVKRTIADFRYLTSASAKYSVKTFDDYNTALKLAADKVSGTPVILYHKKAGFLKRFLELSKAPDSSEKAGIRLAPYALIISLIIGLVKIITSHSVIVGVSTITATSAVMLIATNFIGLNLPFSAFARKTRRAGAMISGADGVKQLSDSNMVMLADTELFPKGAVVIGGIKAFKEEGVNEAVYAAASLIENLGGTIADVFEQIVTETGAELPKVTGVTLEGDNGISGNVDGRNILVGNRDILIAHGITPPGRDDIMRYLAGGKKALFIAVDGELNSMLVVGYRVDRKRKEELKALEENGVGVIVHSMDANITPSLIAKLFDLSESHISVIHGDLAEQCDRMEQTELSRSDAMAATRGRAESFMNAVNAAKKTKKLEKPIILVQLLGVLIGLIISVVSVGSAHSVSAIALLFFQIVWTAVVMVIPKVLEK